MAMYRRALNGNGFVFLLEKLLVLPLKLVFADLSPVLFNFLEKGLEPRKFVGEEISCTLSFCSSSKFCSSFCIWNSFEPLSPVGDFIASFSEMY